MSSTYIKNIGLENIVKYDLKNKRKQFMVDFSSLDIPKLMSELGFINYSCTYKENTKGFFMNYHLDGVQTFKVNKKEFDMITKDELWKYTMIIYESDYQKDFSGGIFEFCDGERVFPKKGLCILFDSRDVHCVHQITKGTRKNYLIKIY